MPIFFNLRYFLNAHSFEDVHQRIRIRNIYLCLSQIIFYLMSRKILVLKKFSSQELVLKSSQKEAFTSIKPAHLWNLE